MLIAFQTVDFPLDVPNRLAQVLHWLAFLSMPEQVFKSIPHAKILMGAKLDGFNARGMGRVMWRMVDC